jgi:acetyl esterase/lipase
MNPVIFVLALLNPLVIATAQSTNSFPLWADAAPGALGKTVDDIPTLTPFLPATNATGAAMIICPGGGYAKLAPHEGRDYARWLSSHGLACFVLNYRLGTNGYRYPIPLLDAARSLRLLRAHAADWKIDLKRIGMMGSSAGGHVTSMLMTGFDSGNAASADPIERESSRPDFAVLCYPVITMGAFAHSGSKKLLLSPNPSAALIKKASPELHVTKEAPPCFIWGSDEDKTVPIENSLQFADALRKHGVPFELHVYERGRHGIGLGSRDFDPAKWHPWTTECLRWLRERGFAQ